MAMQITNIRGWVLGLVVVAGAGCRDTIENADHCWVAEGDKTCKDLFGGGFCSNDVEACEGYEVPYGCVFEKPVSDECYSPTGNNASCAGPDPAPECTEVAGESGESGMSESSESSDESETSESPMCGDGAVDGDEECDDSNDDETDECTSSCTLPACGDGIVSPSAGEDCDGTNTRDGEICNAACQVVGSLIWENYSNIAGVDDDDVGYEVEIDADGNIDILVGDGGNYRVVQLTETGALSWDVPLGPWDSAPKTDLAVGVDGRVIVGGVSNDHGHVRQLDSDGNSVGADYAMGPIMSPNSAVLAVDVDSNGEAVVAGYDDSDAVLFGLDENNELTWEYMGEIQAKFGPIAAGTDGRIRVSQTMNETGLLRLFESNGAILTSLGGVAGTDARAMTLDSSNNVFLLIQAEAENYTLSKHDASLGYLWSEARGTSGAEEEANGVAVLPDGGALVAGNTGAPGQRRGKLSWFSPEGEDVLQLVIEEDADNVDARLYDVAVSPDGYAVAVGSRKVGMETTKLWVRKFVI